MFGSSQMKSALYYIFAVTVALIILNLYTSHHARTMLFKSRYSDLNSTGSLISASLNSAESLNSDSVRQIIELLDIDSDTSVIVADYNGICLYSSDETVAEYISLLSDYSVCQALSGKDYFHCSYQNGVTNSVCSVPIVYYDHITGCVFLQNYEYDQSAMIQALERNLFLVSAVLELSVISFAMLFAFLFSRRTAKILASFPYVRSGDYSYRIHLSGNDELAKLSDEFDKLTEKLEDSEELRRRFVSDASHELKTPLASIKLLGETILQNELDESTEKEFIGDICSEAERLNRMSQKLLQLSKMDSMLDEEKEIVSIQPVAERVFRMLQPLADSRKIQLIATAEIDCTVLATEDDIYQILFNLVENGIKYNHDGGTVHLQYYLEDDDVIISVKDTGVGIPLDAQPHIFERFFRVDKARSRKAGGTGLGLSIVHDIVSKNFGTIDIQSYPNQGTEFILHFPYFAVPENQE